MSARPTLDLLTPSKVLSATFEGFKDGVPQVDWGNGAVAARSVVQLDQLASKSEVVLAFDGGDLALPIILGVIQPAITSKFEAEADGRRLIVEGQDEVVLRCGKASITLRRNGKVVIRGVYVESAAEGTHRIKGGSVQIN